MNKLFLEFFKTERASGLLLIGCAVTSMALANSAVAENYLSIWQIPLFGQTLIYWINDGLMTFFFLLIGLEIEREMYVGELSRPKQALLPILAAAGGMILPALFHFSLNAGTPTQAGIGIPMATDIAFALGILSLLGSRVPLSLKVFLTALAIIDDLGAIVIIGFFYSHGFAVTYFLLAIATVGILFGFRLAKVQSLAVYLFGGCFLWYFTYQSGIHATISGVALAFLIPFGKGDATSPSTILQHKLHYLVAFGIVPFFALANTALQINSGAAASLLSSNSLGIILGLVLGKPLGIVALSAIAVRFGIGSLPPDVSWNGIVATSILGGVGFTMSIFITLLAFGDAATIEQSKIAIICGSTAAGLAGYASLHLVFARRKSAQRPS